MPRRAVDLAACAVTVAVAAAGQAGAAPAAPGHRTGLSGPGRADTAYTDRLCAAEGDLLDVRIGDVRATQPSVGYDGVYYKLGRYALAKDAVNKKFDDWCEANGQLEAASASSGARLDDPASFTCELPVGSETGESVAAMKTVVVGPGGSLYLTDGHHTLTSFFETPDGGSELHGRLRVVANYATLAQQESRKRMEANRWVWPRDPEGAPVPLTGLPKSLGLSRFQDDRYRSLLHFARDIGCTPGTRPFQPSYLDTVEKVSRAQSALPAGSPVADGLTAGELGALAEWNAGKAADKGEFAKLSVPYAEARPGKLAYALRYKDAHGIG
ncbi:chromosome partitioning protein ParB [Streptomyces albidoflavus]|nr:chromosome partitioning protein ParB [Streptomyces albidoflavus]PAX90341.1 chromosome partitioning protein ParB [Streptomyces albidoflavus]PBO18129.1 chromosome partitioning protein ParB [Streptomyces albidoflavus]PBO24067.1 chromosome partitioning protein ParB [Streptomyces albidoflavus]PBO30273.1 chromosome partitioning protein ParB [Streptomyces albidoflavus]